MTVFRRAAVIAILGVGGVAACTVATPTTQPRTERPATSQSLATQRPSATPGSSFEEPTETASDLGSEIRVAGIGPELTENVLEFASSGEYVLFTTAPESETASDLWALDAYRAGEPQIIWRNPRRDHAVVKFDGDLDTIAFVDMPANGQKGWDLWVIPERGAQAILLDSHPGDPDVPGLSPSFDVYKPSIAWAAFDSGPNGPVSQLLYAEAPDWTPQLIAERDAAEAEYWFPSLLGASLVYQEIVYSDDGKTDERHVYLMTLDQDPSRAMRLDASGRASMPLINQFGIVWKEADPGFNMLNWGTMWRHDPGTGTASRLDTGPQAYVNFPSIGDRFIAWWLEDPTQFGVFDLERGAPRQMFRYDSIGDGQVFSPHISVNTLVWRHVEEINGRSAAEIRYAVLPGAGDDRLRLPSPGG